MNYNDDKGWVVPGFEHGLIDYPQYISHVIPNHRNPNGLVSKSLNNERWGIV